MTGLPVQFSFGFEGRFGVSPDNNQELLFSVIRNAQKSLFVNVYQIDNTAIVEELEKKIESGVCVQLMIEGAPVGGVSAQGLNAIDRLTEAMIQANTRENSVRKKVSKKRKFFADLDSILTSDESTQAREHVCVADHFYLFLPKKETLYERRRYVFDHAKYVVADDRTALVTSENFSTNGHPTPGLQGSRGWEVALEDADLAHHLYELFQEDSDGTDGDVVDLVGDSEWTASKFRSVLKEKAESAPSSVKHRSADSFRLGSGEVQSAQIYTSPNSLGALKKFIRSAKQSLQIEFLYVNKMFSGEEKSISPIVVELIEAAKRGVYVQVLLNDDRTFAAIAIEKKRALEALLGDSGRQESYWESRDDTHPKNGGKKIYPNFETATYLTEIATENALPIEVRIADTKSMEVTYVHNKGLLADNNRVFVSSINGSENSIMRNREVAVELVSRDANRYFKTIFNFDWDQSPQFSVKNWYKISPFSNLGSSAFSPSLSSGPR